MQYKNLFSLLLLFLCTVTVCAQEYRDVVYLKNGSVIKGFYKSFFLNDTLRMETLDGSLLVCPASDIVRIAKERTDVYVVHADKEDGFVRRWRPKGYSGSFEYTNGHSTYESSESCSGITTTHGYQFNRNVFLGTGVGVERYFSELNGYNIETAKMCISLYGEGRFYLMNTRIAPALYCRGGYSFNGIKGPFIAPGVGVDFSTSPRFGIFLRFMYRWQKFEYNRYIIKSDAEIDTYSIKENGSLVMFCAGFHF